MLKTLKNIRRRDTDKFMIPHSVQEVIPIRTVWKSGILLVGQNRYSRTWQFSDINYALAGEEDQKSMLLGYSALLNLCDSNADTKLSIVTVIYRSRIIPLAWDAFSSSISLYSLR